MPTSATGLPPRNASTAQQGTSLAAWSLKDFVETTPSSMAMFDTEIRYLSVSPSFLLDNRITGETQQSIVGRSVFEFRRDNEKARDINRRVLSGETLIKEDFCFRRPDGSVMWMRWQMQPCRQPGGSVGGAVEIIQARKEAGEKLIFVKFLPGATSP
jgi:PAS domain S-box-containing protein